MSLEERTGVRDLTYSGWHRTSRIRRYLRYDVAAILKLIDIDCCEACHFCSQPLALIETQSSTGPPKAARITALLATMASIPAYSVSYTTEAGDITGFRVQPVAPTLGEVTDVAPKAYAEWLLSLRDGHSCAGYEQWALTRREAS